MHNFKRNTAYCNALSAYSSCTRKTARTCRGDLAYHTAVYVIEDLIIQNNCSKEEPTAVPRPPTKHDFPSIDTCDYEKIFIHKHNRPPTYKYCAVFGDPHIRTFIDEFYTCQVEGSWPLLDNNYLFVQATIYPIIKGSNGIGKVGLLFHIGVGQPTERMYSPASHLRIPNSLRKCWQNIWFCWCDLIFLFFSFGEWSKGNCRIGLYNMVSKSNKLHYGLM